MRSLRMWVMSVLAVAVVLWYWRTDPNGGAQMSVSLQSLVGVLVAAPLVYYLRRFFAEQARGRELIDMIRKGNTAAGLAYLGLCLLTGMLFMAISPRALAAPLPGNAAQDLPLLRAEIQARWPDMPMPSMLAAQVEQESRWKPLATLKTSREEGVGYGQFTRAYRADGSLRFDALAEVVRMDKSLSGWNWADRYNPRMQLRAVVVKNRGCFNRIQQLIPDQFNALAMCDAAYNGGEGGLLAERRLCHQISGCNPGIWFGHVEQYSTKSRVKWHGYGASAFEINRTHVRNVMLVRRPKYVPLMEGAA